LNDTNAQLVRHWQRHRLAEVSVVALTVVCLACSSEEKSGADTPAFSPAPTGASTNSGAGGAGTGPSGTAGGNGSASPSSEQPAAGNGTAIAGTALAGSAGAGGSAATTGSAGSSMVAAAGSGMVASAGAAGQLGMPASNECQNGAFFCEDFEGLALGALTAGVNGMQPERTVSVIAEPGRGQVLAVQAGPGYGNKAGIFLNDVARPDNSHFGRMFVNVAAFPVAVADHWVIVEATGNGGDQVRPVGGQFQRWAPGADGPSAGDWTDWQQSTAATAAGAWECVEWQINGANGGNDLLLWVDDVQVQPLDRPGFSLPAVNRLWIGWVVYQMGAPSQYDVRIDDIVLSTQRIGCN
jgi:hypothetical protein